MEKFKYDIDYSHLKYDLIDKKIYCSDNGKNNYAFNKVKEYADEIELELSDEEFSLLFKMKISDKDAEWIMRMMKNYNKSLASALVSYICY